MELIKGHKSVIRLFPWPSTFLPFRVHLMADDNDGGGKKSIAVWPLFSDQEALVVAVKYSDVESLPN